MKALFKVGDKVIIKHTGEVVTIRRVVKAAYYCYYFSRENGEACDGYYTYCDLIKK